MLLIKVNEMAETCDQKANETEATTETQACTRMTGYY
jgi:hypothetical protein